MPIPRRLRTTFDERSKLYESVRVGYPEELIDDIVELSGISEDGKILDVGCGSGKATILFAKRRYNIIGADISKNLVKIAKENSASFPNVTYQITSFEDVNFTSKEFDLIISAQAWHWVDPAVGYKKAHSLLNDSGALALFWKFQDREKSGLLASMMELFKKHCPDFPLDIGSTKPTEEKLTASGLFSPFIKREYNAVVSYTKKNYLGLTQTMSYVASLPEEKRAKLLSEMSTVLSKEKDPITVPLRYTLLVAKKK